jgi:4-oxalocrotonate tautomerase
VRNRFVHGFRPPPPATIVAARDFLAAHGVRWPLLRSGHRTFRGRLPGALRGRGRASRTSDNIPCISIPSTTIGEVSCLSSASGSPTKEILRSRRPQVIKEVTETLERVLHKPPEWTHVAIEEVDTDNGGFGGRTTSEIRNDTAG